MWDPVTVLVCFLSVFVIAVMKGGFGGGFAIIGIPFIALVLDPLTAGALLAPIFVIMDFIALRVWKPSTWSWPDLKVLLPGMVIGIALGSTVLSGLEPNLVSILLAVVTLGFAARWFAGYRVAKVRNRNTALALVASITSGFTTMIAHSGGPPLTLYLLRIGLPKAVYAGTISAFFTAGNVLKVGPWLVIAGIDRDIWLLIVLISPSIPLGLWAGLVLHNRVDQRQLSTLCYSLLILAATHMLIDGVLGYLE
ncbi:MAG: sulfite exporter TauE/SafE family protein [Pseudomonadota bacterium]